ncbi:MAG TPA: sulfurtransferase TusA family protein [Rhodospirillales bacterium]|nr:sulfurtransferase TusA family protein [Rhodospirillales bacterium]
MTTILDVQGLQCPLPVLRASRALRPLAPGDELRVLATDPAAPADFAAFCQTTGHTLIASDEADGVFCIRIRKAG